MSEDQSKKEIVKADSSNIVQYSNSLLKRTLTDIAKITSVKIVRKRILLIDDDYFLLRLLSDTISTFGEFDILTASDGEEGLQIVRKEEGRIDLIITDLNHPKIDGIEMSKIIKKEYPKIPIILQTGHRNNIAIKSLSTEEIFFKILSKPYRLNTLFETIKSAIL